MDRQDVIELGVASAETKGMVGKFPDYSLGMDEGLTED